MSGIFFLIVIGAAAGFLATRFMDVKMGVLQTVLLGMAGAVIGGLVLNVVLAFLGLLGGLIGAILGAMALIWAIQAVSNKR